MDDNTVPKKLTTEEFIKKANLIHNNYYDYSDTVYIKSSENVYIKCPVHGVFEQRASNHLNGQGCKDCSYDSFKLSIDEFVSRANELHNNFYDYSDVIYINAHNKVKIKCHIHGVFEQTPLGHLKGQGCKECYYNDLKLSLDLFIIRANKIHDHKYDYSNSIYNGVKSKIKIKCPVHGVFEQRASNHLNGQGCPDCNFNTISKEKFIEVANGNDCIFYIIKCFDSNESFYKIGITTRTIGNRFNSKVSMPYNYTIIKEFKADAETIWNIERQLKKILKSSYVPMINFSGSLNECFSDYEEIYQNLINKEWS